MSETFENRMLSREQIIDFVNGRNIGLVFVDLNDNPSSSLAPLVQTVRAINKREAGASAVGISNITDPDLLVGEVHGLQKNTESTYGENFLLVLKLLEGTNANLIIHVDHDLRVWNGETRTGVDFISDLVKFLNDHEEGAELAKRIMLIGFSQNGNTQTDGSESNVYERMENAANDPESGINLPFIGTLPLYAAALRQNPNASFLNIGNQLAEAITNHFYPSETES